MKRERLKSRLGFILLSAGCAIGCGNVWKFPWMVGQNGGGAFLLVYFVFLILLGLPAVTMEFSIGRRAQASPMRMYQQIEKPGQKWHLHGYVCYIGNTCLMAFYTVVTGWMIYYFISFALGKQSELSFDSMIANPTLNVSFLAIAVFICFVILAMGLQGGLEKITKIMMVCLFILMFVLVIRSVLMPGAKEGLRFYLIPDFSSISWSVIVAAMNQAFFSLSVGIGAMAIFGSYIDKERSLLSESINVIILDTLVAVMAGLIIFPSCFSFDLEVSAGPALLFNTMASVFNNMNGGRVWGSLFFLFMVFAALSTELAVCENIVACTCEITKMSRKKSCLCCGIVIFVISLTTALGFSVWKFTPFYEGSTWLDFWDFIVSNNLLPLGSLSLAIFCTIKRGWGWENFVAEANEGKGLKVKNWMKPLFKYFVPIAVLGIYIVGMVNFFAG